jgi:hypothetical protein
MFKHISLFSKRLLRMTLIEIVFFVALFAGLAMMTLLFAVLMLMRWHVDPAMVMLTCLLPWLLLIVGLGIAWVIYDRRVKRSRNQLFGFQYGELLYSLIPLAFNYFLSKKKRSSR